MLVKQKREFSPKLLESFCFFPRFLLCAWFLVRALGVNNFVNASSGPCPPVSSLSVCLVGLFVCPFVPLSVLWSVGPFARSVCLFVCLPLVGLVGSWRLLLECLAASVRGQRRTKSCDGFRGLGSVLMVSAIELVGFFGAFERLPLK